MPVPLVLISGPSNVGKTYVTEQVLAVQYDVTTDKMDPVYRRALADAGIKSERVRQEAHALRDGTHSPEVVERFFASWDESVQASLRRAIDFDVALVLEGYTLTFADEVERLVACATELFGVRPPVVRIVVRPSLEQWNINRTHRLQLLTPGGVDAAPYTQEDYDREFADLTPVEGVLDYVAQGAARVEGLVRKKANVRPHKWYQNLSAGPIKFKGPSDAREKAAVLRPEDVYGKSVLDVCCATGIVSMLVRDRGAARVVGVEIDKRRYAKSLELKKIFLRNTPIEARADLRLGDAREIVPTLGQFDTVFMFGALHYFSDYHGMLSMLADASTDAVYVEFMLPEFSDVWNGEPGVQPYVRPSGTTVYTADSATLLQQIIPTAMPGFAVVSRYASPGLAGGVDSYREIWRLKRQPAS